jgi:hypothetical protein
VFAPYEPRPLAFLGGASVAGYRLKVYSILYGDRPFDAARFRRTREIAATALPQPAVTTSRPGIGFAIQRQGKTGDYVIFGWWDQENELPIRVFVADAGGWRPARDGESFCVWDLRVIWSEREAYVGTVLAGRDDVVDAYLAATVEGLA